MMFSEGLRQYAQGKYEERLPLLGAVRAEVEAAMKGLSEEEQVLMKFLYGTMPLRDGGEYGFSVFLGFVRHSLMVRSTMDWCRNVPEAMFLHHILYYRVNTENIEDCRRFFYDQLMPRIRGLSASEAALEINHWCAENGTYETSDNRTISPLTLYRSGKGRCGEESTFAVTAFRSVGIPSRQVYTPRWAHCDDNHAWVEVFVDGSWHFLGACEPEPMLDMGWFSNASSRAMLVHTRTFSDFMGQGERCMGRDGGLVFYNETAAYGLSKPYEISVFDEKGKPVAGACVSIEILNMAEYCSVGALYTGKDGKVCVTAGLGDMHLWVTKEPVPVKPVPVEGRGEEARGGEVHGGEAYGGEVHGGENGLLCGEAWASVKNTDGVSVELKERIENREGGNGKPDSDSCLMDVDVEAPSDYPMHPVKPSKEQREENRQRIQEAGQKRLLRIESYFDKDQAKQYPGEAKLLHLAGGNFSEIVSFLSRDGNPDRVGLLKGLAVKDYKDAKDKVLESHLRAAAPYRREWEDKGQLELYFQFILCPRILLEEMTDYRTYIEDYFTDAQKREFRRSPAILWDWIKTHIGYEPQLDYKTICSTPVGCLKLRQGNLISRKLLFVAVMRTLGIPARVNKVDQEAEVYVEDKFVKISHISMGIGGHSRNEGHVPGAGARLRLLSDGQDRWTYFQTWTIGRFMGNRYVTLDYTGIQFKEGSLELELEPGIYRLITTNRLPNGNQRASECVFRLTAGEEKRLVMRQRTGSLEELLVSHKLEDFELAFEGEKTAASAILEGCANIVAFLSEGEEPTEHILNEMLEQAGVLNRMLQSGSGAQTRALLVVRNREALKHPSLKAVLEAIPEIRTAICRFEETVEPLARRMYADPDKLPLLLVTNPGLRGIYGCSGYNVGSVDLMIKLLELSRRTLE